MGALWGGAAAWADAWNPAQSSITFVGTQMGAKVQGRFKHFDATVHFDPKDLAHSQARLAIDLGSIDLASDESEDEIKGLHWFNVRVFPQAVFESTAIQAAGPDQYWVMGQLRLKGVSQPLRIPLHMTYDHGSRIARGQFVLRRNDFKVGDGTWAATDTVADDVTVTFLLTLTS